ncbi:hypothetical protein [uncultured Albimonas sp.]|uniref:hypothetical protein n=1 Tax=uncultured Albimonas sp. TaxID=1331701 RepID=UPI0030EE142E|tara:strand:- start:4049 stop:4909 length:861 start_codon:yes stop_codon:yes gene_type:complete
MTSGFIGDLLRYGNWSGPGWTAAREADDFAAVGKARILSDAELRIAGVDAYDNYVAKAHDLNEYQAEHALRARLAELGLASAEQSLHEGAPAWAKPLVFGGAGGDDHRFVSYRAYRGELERRGPDLSDRVALGEGFLRYYTHIMRSNLQFALDYKDNGVALFSGGTGAARMLLQLAGAAHVFLTEAAKLEVAVKTIRNELDLRVARRRDLSAWLETVFVTPDAEIFAAEGLDPYAPTAPRQVLIAAPIDDLQNLAAMKIASRNAVGRAEVRRIVAELHQGAATAFA